MCDADFPCRQHELWHSFGFRCACDLCASSPDLQQGLPRPVGCKDVREGAGQRKGLLKPECVTGERDLQVSIIVAHTVHVYGGTEVQIKSHQCA